MWYPERKNAFKKQFKKLSSELKRKATTAITELSQSEDPRKLGVYKKAMRVYSYEIDRSNRIIFDVDFSKNTISFIRVGSHKAAYGKD